MINDDRIQLALPKGHMYAAVEQLLGDAGLAVQGNGRNYRPVCADDRFELKILKPQNIVRMVELGSHDVAFAGYDWVVELGAAVRELLDTALDPVCLVAAAPQELARDPAFFHRRLLVASEYETITRRYRDGRRADYLFVRSFGATEVFPPEDADLIVDNTASGRTLRENGLAVVDTLLRSSTRLIANPAAMDGPKGRTIAELAMLVQAVLDARSRVMLEMNVAGDRLPAVLAVLPCMRKPTMSSLSDGTGFAVKAAVPKFQVVRLIPELKAAGATDILEYPFSKVVL